MSTSQYIMTWSTNLGWDKEEVKEPQETLGDIISLARILRASGVKSLIGLN